jgi:Ran GTPase-activating protein (RanGAP) involved in mRNA processing and transport
LDIKAILSALTESTSPTLTHFDLSFNHISISFLQDLQQHLESYGTFKSLQNLGLKGSLNNDVTTGFLANFSGALSSKCNRLRRLDLSENNLGEPGNPDLCKMISQLLSLGRDFNLCLNDEYMSEVHDEFICVMEESIKKKGTINHTIAHGVIVGPGRSGKNTLMSRLMGIERTTQVRYCFT